MPERPKITGRNSATEGDELTLQCTASGNPIPNVTWTKDDNDVELASTVQTAVSTLIISSVTREDSGVYKCTATNAAGAGSNTLSVKVKRKRKCV